MIATILLMALIAIGLTLYLKSPPDRSRTARVGEILYFVALVALLCFHDPFKLLK